MRNAGKDSRGVAWGGGALALPSPGVPCLESTDCRCVCVCGGAIHTPICLLTSGLNSHGFSSGSMFSLRGY